MPPKKTDPPAFLCPAGTTTVVYNYEDFNQYGPLHGHIFVDSEPTRADRYFVAVQCTDQNTRETYLRLLDITDGGIPVEATREIEDPLSYYHELEGPLSGSGRNPQFRIRLDPVRHKGIIGRAAGGREVSADRGVYAYSKMGSAGPYHVSPPAAMANRMFSMPDGHVYFASDGSWRHRSWSDNATFTNRSGERYSIVMLALTPETPEAFLVGGK